MPVNLESTPPPRIGKIGPYTVFITPPSTPTPPGVGSVSGSPRKVAAPVSPPPPPVQSPVKPPVAAPPPVQAPPSQFYSTKSSGKSHSSFGFFWDAVAKVQNAHANLDEQVAYWFGLNQSKYQWALDDYYENKAAVSVSFYFPTSPTF
ncbi:OLC1v1035107C3 [Oldenlandia corymbosa var. corymbosa]|uniref:OLC1v1035107C3 n=1 Tax=Oldenlandia corymbosa var. corymbosa TaxID=529605 RepID=A0AAV1CVA3_OLDCO|nr:OLC1v1035107C3 [Oldenlandia corymbosa var. corymbosa]